MPVNEITYVEALNQALREEMKRDERVFIMGEDIGVYAGAFKVTRGLLDEFGPKRIRNTPISEAAIVGAATGAALTGMRPIAEIMYVDFMTLAMDQIVNQMAKVRYMFGGKASVPLVVRTQGGAGRGNAAQHSQSLEAWFVHTPGLYVVQPSTPYDAKGLLKTAIRNDNPIIFIEHKLLYGTKGPVPEEEYLIPLGKADIKRQGRDVTLVATSMMVLHALKAAETLSKEGIEAEVIDPRTLKPLDTETIVTSVKKTMHLVVINEGCRAGGYAGHVAATVMEDVFDYLDAPIQIVASKDVPIPYNRTLEYATIPGEQDILDAVRKIVR